MQQLKSGTIVGCSLLVMGSCSGGGLMALPVFTGIGGFYPGIAMTFLIWAITLATGLLLLEATLGMPDGSNMISLAGHYLGRTAKVLFALAFLALYYTFMVDFYLSSVSILQHICKNLFGIDLPTSLATLFNCLFFAGIAFLGTRASSRLNALFIMGFFITLTLITLGEWGAVRPSYLKRFDWTFMFLAGPILFAVFTYHNLIPTITSMLRRNVKKIVLSIFIGTLLALGSYILWQYLMIGIFSEGTLWEVYERGGLTEPLFHLKLENPFLKKALLFLMLFDIVTSLVALALSIVDFLGDGLKIPYLDRVGLKRGYLVLLTFFPPALFSYFFTVSSKTMVGVIEGFGQIILFAFFPVLLALSARHNTAHVTPRLVPGGAPALFLILILSFYIIYLQGISLLP